MRLKRVELAGFKSFVDPTKIDLGEGITGIVGPNGCGKSNIVDAIRWVLGEHSAKHLRGGVMDDLVFQGSQTRPPVAMCDVELTFSVNPGQLSPPYHEMEEIRVRRRLHRESGSDAFINGKMVRIKDIVDLFLDTGVSTRAYAIVEQGSIARMLTAKPEERRLMLEEAAGVMKYRARKREAERKMKDTRINLERVLDLLEEVRTQCRSLKQQASRAERFKKQQDELQHVQSLSMGIRYRRQKQACTTVEQEIQQARAREDQVAGQQAGMERQLAEARDALIAHEAEAQAEQDKLRAAEQQRAELQQKAERLAGERRLLAERKTSLNERLKEAEARKVQLAKQVSELASRTAEQDDAELQAALELAHVQVDEALQKHAKERQRRDELLAEYERLRGEQENVETGRKQAEAAVERLEARIAAMQSQQAEARQQLQNTEELFAKAKENAEAARNQQEQAVGKLNLAQKQLDAARAGREKAQLELSDQEAMVRRLKGDAEELKARLDSRDVSGEVRDRIRDRGAIWVDEALRAPEGLELAVAAALRGQGADARIPASNLSDWRETFQQVEDSPIAFFTGSKGRAVSGSLSEHLGLAHDHPMYDMFSSVLLVDDILRANLDGSGFTTAVSRGGWRMEQNGWLSPPAHKRTATRLMLQRNLRERVGELAKAEQQLASLHQAFQQADETLNQRQSDWQESHLAMTEAQSERQSSQAKSERLQGEQESIQTRIARLAEDHHEAEADLEHWRGQLTGEVQTDTGRIDAARQALYEQTDIQQQAEDQLDQSRAALASAEQALALKQQAMQSLKAEEQRVASEQQRLTHQTEEDKSRLQEAEAELSSAEKQDEMDAALREAAFEGDRIHRQLNHLRQHGSQLQQTAHEAERDEREVRTRQQQAAEERQKIELHLATEQTRLQDLSEEIKQRCRISPEKLLQTLEAMEEPVDEQDILAKAQQLEERLARFGPVNLLAIEEYGQVAEREKFLDEQAKDLDASLQTLMNTINRIDRTTRDRFADAFERTNAFFQETFPRLFGGGRAELRLDSDDPLTAGVEIIAQPPGKHLQDVGLLSGGEKALTAVALVFSIFRLKPAPFCILDEVDAPLDDANVQRFGEMLEELSRDVQFLTITHNKISMQMASCLIGVSMPEPGVSRIVGVDVRDYETQAAAA